MKTYPVDWGYYFTYDHETGKLYWRVKVSRKVIIGAEAGWFCKSSGYLKVRVDGCDFRTHRIIWDMLHQEDLLLEDEEIDHIDHDKANNRPENLRKVSGLGNRRNMPRNLNNTSGTTGVTFDTSRGKWVAQIKVNYKKIHLGRFNDKQNAIKARKAAEKFYGFHENHGKDLA